MRARFHAQPFLRSYLTEGKMREREMFKSIREIQTVAKVTPPIARMRLSKGEAILLWHLVSYQLALEPGIHERCGLSSCEITPLCRISRMLPRPWARRAVSRPSSRLWRANLKEKRCEWRQKALTILVRRVVDEFRLLAQSLVHSTHLASDRTVHFRRRLCRLHLRGGGAWKGTESCKRDSLGHNFDEGGEASHNIVLMEGLWEEFEMFYLLFLVSLG